MSEECPGEGRCHGCLSWCDSCSEVSNTCDDPGCDTHLREEDVQREMDAIEREIKELAVKCRKLEIRVSGEGVVKSWKRVATIAMTTARTELNREIDNITYAERDLCRFQERHRTIRKAGESLVPRKVRRDEYGPGRQLLMFA